MHFILIPDWEGMKVPSYFLSPFSYMSSKVRKTKKRGGKSREEWASDPFMPFFFFLSIYFNCFCCGVERKLDKLKSYLGLSPALSAVGS